MTHILLFRFYSLFRLSGYPNTDCQVVKEGLEYKKRLLLKANSPLEVLEKETKIYGKKERINMTFENNSQLNINNLIQSEVNRISQKYNKDFLDCEDLIKITGLGRDNVRNLMRSKNFPTTKVGKRQVVSVLNFVTWLTLNNNTSEVQNG